MFLTKEEKDVRKQIKQDKIDEEIQKQKEWDEAHTAKRREKLKTKAQEVARQREEERLSQNGIQTRKDKRIEIWATKDAKGKMMMERYNLYEDEKAQAKKEQRQKELAEMSNSPHTYRAPRASDAIKSSKPPPAPLPRFYTPSHSDPTIDRVVAAALPEEQGGGVMRSSTGAMNTAIPKPTAFSTTTVQLQYKNNMCYWPVPLVTEQNLKDRFEIKKPALRLASMPKGKLAIKFKPLADGRYSVQPGQSYVVFNLKDKKDQLGRTADNGSCELTYEQKVLRFLTMEKFTRGENLVGGSGIGDRMVREEVFKFTAAGRFVYKELKGYKKVEGSMRETFHSAGTYKLKIKDTTTRVNLKFEMTKEKKKEVKKKSSMRTQDRLQEIMILYKSWFIPGDGTIKCVADQTIRFK